MYVMCTRYHGINGYIWNITCIYVIFYKKNVDYADTTIYCFRFMSTTKLALYTDNYTHVMKIFKSWYQIQLWIIFIALHSEIVT